MHKSLNLHDVSPSDSILRNNAKWGMFFPYLITIHVSELQEMLIEKKKCINYIT